MQIFIKQLIEGQAGDRGVVLVFLRIKHGHVRRREADRIGIDILAESRFDVHRHRHALPDT